ncbi:MAG: hypothetical protein FJ404_15105 [Verrucomicrobia bacterium]|nr:hypothetical protein [Verrucomicrobiota bacterium]
MVPAIALFAKLQSNSREQMEARFLEETDRIEAGLKQRLESAFKPVRVAAGFFSTDPAASRADWDRFVERLGFRERRSSAELGLTDLGLIWRVSGADRGERVKQWQGLGYARVQESARYSGAEAFFTLLLENFEGRQPLDTGWSLDVENKVRLAMELA